MRYRAKYLSLVLLNTAMLFSGGCTGNSAGGCYAPIRTTWVPITVGQNLYTQYHKLLFPDISGEYEENNSCNPCSWGADFSVTYRYIQSRNSAQIAQSLWGSNVLLFQGNAVQQRQNNALIAEYFGMAPDTDGYISLCPQLRNQVVDFQFSLASGHFWAQVNLPVAYAKWLLNNNCNIPNFQGIYGQSNLDGASISLNYPASGGATIAGITMQPIDNILYFDGGDNATSTNSFTAAINDGGFTNVNTNIPEVDTIPVKYSPSNNPLAGNFIGYINMGLYGDFDNGGADANIGLMDVTFTTEDVLPAPSVGEALRGYTFGMVKERKNNLFNFNACGKWNLADIPIMLGYDFFKSDATHLGLYFKFVIPTGTKIDSCFLKYVLTPVIGNGRHFELGIGLTGHMNVWACDDSSFSFHADGYVDYMFANCQTRSFDLPGQPMSRYALVYPLQSNSSDQYDVMNVMCPIGDKNLYQGNINATRGEIIIDAIWKCKRWEFGLGYAFTGQTSEKMNCIATATLGSNNAYALVGNGLQQMIGVGPISAGNPATGTFNVSPYDLTTTFPLANFFYLGPTQMTGSVSSGENAAYTYGNVIEDTKAAFVLPNVQGNSSGLMNGQILNRIFGHIDYIWTEYEWEPEIGIVGSIGFVPVTKPTANYWDLGVRIGFAF